MGREYRHYWKDQDVLMALKEEEDRLVEQMTGEELQAWEDRGESFVDQWVYERAVYE